jgi:hypothetical protein
MYVEDKWPSVERALGQLSISRKALVVKEG